MDISVETLHIERTSQNDHSSFCVLLSDPIVTEMNGRTADVEMLFKRYLNNLYSFSVFNENTFVGLCSLFPTSLSSAVKSINSLELVYSVLPEYWNNGIASFAVERMCKLGFDEIGLNCIFAGCFTDNTASARVLQKSGFKLIFHRELNSSINNKTESIYLKTGLK